MLNNYTKHEDDQAKEEAENKSWLGQSVWLRGEVIEVAELPGIVRVRIETDGDEGDSLDLQIDIESDDIKVTDSEFKLVNG